MPSQFFRNWRGEQALKSAECQLLVAVIADAVDCFQKHWGSEHTAGQRLFREAEHWIMEPAQRGFDDSSTGFSFEYACEMLGIDPDRVRAALRGWANARGKATRPAARAS